MKYKRLALTVGLALLCGCASRVQPTLPAPEPKPDISFWEQSALEPDLGYSRLRVESNALSDSGEAYTYYDADFIAKLWRTLDRSSWSVDDAEHNHLAYSPTNGLELTFYNGSSYDLSKEDNRHQYDVILLYDDGCAILRNTSQLLTCYQPGEALYNRVLQQLLDYGTTGVEMVDPADFLRGINGSSGVLLPDGQELSFSFLSGDEQGRRHQLLMTLGLDLSKDWDSGTVTWRFLSPSDDLPTGDPDLFFTPNRFGVYIDQDLAVIYSATGQPNWYALPPGTGQDVLNLLSSWNS